MSRSETTGAASAAPLATVTRDGATPALADQWEAEALDAIESVQDPAEAERLLGNVTIAAEAMRIERLGVDRERRWKMLQLKAERRFGELLGPAQNRGRATVTRGYGPEHRMQASRARKVAAVPQDIFDDYVHNDLKPSRRGLLRHVPKAKAAPRRREYNNKYWENDEVIAWVARRTKAGRTRDEIVEESEAGAHDWPLPAQPLGKNAADIARAIVADRARRGDTMRRREPSGSGRRLRQLHAEKRAGRTGDLWDLQVAIAQAVGGLEAFRLPDLDWSEDTEALMADLYDDLERHVRWSEAAFETVTAHMSELGRQRKIQALEARANDPSSTPAERASAAKRAEVLRRKRKRLSSAS